MPGTEFSPLPITAWGLIALGGVLLLSLLGRLGQAFRRRFRPVNVWARYAQESSPHRRRRGGLWGCLSTFLLLLLALLSAGAGWSLLRLDMALQVYEPFPRENIAARIQCVPVDVQVSSTMTCSLSMESPVYSDTLILQGGRWGLHGEMVAWDSTLENLGLRSGYRLIQLESYDPQGRVVDVVALPSTGTGLGTVLIWLDRYVPFVVVEQKVISGEAVAGQFYELIVSREGFALREWGPVRP